MRHPVDLAGREATGVPAETAEWTARPVAAPGSLLVGPVEMAEQRPVACTEPAEQAARPEVPAAAPAKRRTVREVEAADSLEQAARRPGPAEWVQEARRTHPGEPELEEWRSLVRPNVIPRARVGRCA